MLISICGGVGRSNDIESESNQILVLIEEHEDRAVDGAVGCVQFLGFVPSVPAHPREAMVLVPPSLQGFLSLQRGFVVNVT